MDAVFHFIRAALPWIAVGLLLAVLFARSAGKNKYLFPFYFVLKTKTPGQANLLPDRIWQAAFSKALGRSTTPSHPHSPGAAHSSKAEVASEKFQKVVSHARPCSFL